MRILFDHSCPYNLARHLAGHTVSTAEEYGWDRLTNGELLQEADLLLTADKNLSYQQNLSRCKIGIAVLGHSPWPLVRYAEVEIPLPPRKPFTRF